MEYLRGLAGGLANEVHREAILAHCFEDEPLETMAQRTGIPVGTLKSGCYRAKRTLIDTLKRKGTFDEYNALNT
jgi:DNA-directed RNA polymerase specialized sigma24 family protein